MPGTSQEKALSRFCPNFRVLSGPEGCAQTPTYTRVMSTHDTTKGDGGAGMWTGRHHQPGILAESWPSRKRTPSDYPKP